MTMNFNELPEFKRELKQLHKKYTSLTEDLSTFRDVLFVTPLGNSRHFAVVTRTDTILIVRARLFCRYLKGSSLRIIYSWNEQEQRIEFIQLYFKGDQRGPRRRLPKASESKSKCPCPSANILQHSHPFRAFPCSSVVKSVVWGSRPGLYPWGWVGAPFSRCFACLAVKPQAPPLAPSTQHPAVQR